MASNEMAKSVDTILVLVARISDEQNGTQVIGDAGRVLPSGA